MTFWLVTGVVLSVFVLVFGFYLAEIFDWDREP
jgi:hypothetical protein